ncbi:MAG: transporter, transrane region, type 1 [Mycobacterium sp.]|nr:transporter, transrane region, type 1 [Mycobacterium sp.]
MNRLHASTAMRRHLAASVCCGVVITGSAIASAVLLAHVISGVITDPSSRTVSHWSGSLWILLTLWLVRAGAQWLQARLSQRGATAVIAEFNERVLTTVCTLPPPQLAALRDQAAVLATRGLDGLRPYFTRYLPAVIMAGLLTPAAVVVMACYDLRSAVIVLIALPLVPLFMVLIGLVTAERSAASLAAMTTLQSRLLDLIAGIPTLRALGRADGPAHRIAELAAAHRRSTMATLRITFLSALVLELLATLGVALVAVSVGLRLVFGEVELSTALTALLLAPEVFWPLRRVGAEFHAAQDGKTAAEKAFGMLDAAPDPIGGTLPVATEASEATGNTTEASEATGNMAAGSSIRLEDVTVDGRDGAAPHRLTADVEPGSVTVLTGPNGAGKSTALQVILGLTRPTSGRVLIAGMDVADLDQRAWWAQVAWLTQRPALVPGTLRENLELFGAIDDLDDACRTAGFDDVLATLPSGLDTVIGRGGDGLSLGQRQRLGIARVLGSRAPVLLLDEPTSHLDAELEDRVLRAVIERARAGATVVLIGHRERVTAVGDRVVHVGGEVLV